MLTFNCAFAIPLCSAVLLLSGCGIVGDVDKILTNDKCCCIQANPNQNLVKNNQFYSCSNKQADLACAVSIGPSDIDHKPDYNSCKDSAFLLPGPALLRDSTIVLVQSNGISAPKVVEVPGQAYMATVTGVKATLEKAYTSHLSTSIATLLRDVPWGQVNTGSIKQFIDRGAILFTGNAAQSDGKEIDVIFQDDRLGTIEVSIPTHLIATVTRTTKNLKFSFQQPPIVILQGIASKYQIPSNQRLESVTFNSDSMNYDFHSAASASDRLSVVVKLSPKAASHASLESPRADFERTLY